MSDFNPTRQSDTGGHIAIFETASHEEASVIVATLQGAGIAARAEPPLTTSSIGPIDSVGDGWSTKILVAAENAADATALLTAPQLSDQELGDEAVEDDGASPRQAL